MCPGGRRGRGGPRAEGAADDRQGPEGCSELKKLHTNRTTTRKVRHSLGAGLSHRVTPRRTGAQQHIPDVQTLRREAEGPCDSNSFTSKWKNPFPTEDPVALHQYLSELKTDLAVEYQVTLRKDQLDRKRFLNRDCTLSNIVANSTGAVSGVLIILGLALAPMTAGASLALSATGLGLGAVVAVTSVPTSIVEHASTLSAKTEVSRLVSTGFLEALKISPRTVSTTKKSTEAVQHIEMNTRAMETVKSNPALAADANVFITSGVIPVQSSQQEEVTFKGTALAMTKGARIVGAGTAGVSLLMEAAFLVKQAKHLHEGAKTESAERLRQQARELEKKLEVLTRIYERLQ
ncbi:hypothetical protein EI555_021484 [Monodon monoceros]|uniref:Apolipoprotein L3 n=2 Tax=Monodon monoceros TaxID=40151 RepID=A0A4U1EFM4_MONMO|nr:hypothetical protein EI555_021484 [Monodon monoceros]